MTQQKSERVELPLVGGGSTILDSDRVVDILPVDNGHPNEECYTSVVIKKKKRAKSKTQIHSALVVDETPDYVRAKIELETGKEFPPR